MFPVMENNTKTPEGPSNAESETDEDDEFAPALPEALDHISYDFVKKSVEDIRQRSEEFYQLMNARRTVRFFSDEAVPKEIIHNIIKTAGTSPSGAHTEPWTFVIVEDKDMKAKIRDIVESEERINYDKRMGKEWTTDLRPLKTSWQKEYLTTAPYLVVVFKQTYGFKEEGKRKKHYYHEMSVSLACGIMLAAIQYCGLVTLTSTPLNAGPALRTLLDRPGNEKLALLLPIGYPALDCTVPNLKRKDIEDIIVEF
ncbi:iodotyrosine deiodinase 1 [Diaphorina citri]|uniref:Iodotyrosine deiodinase 1 n=1 Tax=Diaphorina citri TaxID=121845 RepID=A0A1S3DTX9_DIACI|nr:iodotyrosine deiodinase 1 [Diaphorina citri]